MPRYLIVAHQTAESPELQEEVLRLMKEGGESEFVLLVPATQVGHLLTWTEGESIELARRSATSARARLEATGARVLEAKVGDGSPAQAIADELRSASGPYDSIVICTLPPGVSRWLKLDLPNQARRRFDLPVTHVIAEPTRVEAQG